MAYQSFEMSYQPSNTPYFTVQPMTAPLQPQPVAAPKPTMQEACESLWASMDRKKIKYSVITGVLFLIISSPQLYQLTEFLFGSLLTIASPMGCPTVAGLFLHTIVFTIILFAMMKLPKL